MKGEKDRLRVDVSSSPAVKEILDAAIPVGDPTRNLVEYHAEG